MADGSVGLLFLTPDGVRFRYAPIFRLLVLDETTLYPRRA